VSRFGGGAVTDKLSSAESERFFERLERELSLGSRDWAVRTHVHRAEDCLQYASQRGEDRRA
jgi:hypothetical protein